MQKKATENKKVKHKTKFNTSTQAVKFLQTKKNIKINTRLKNRILLIIRTQNIRPNKTSDPVCLQ